VLDFEILFLNLLNLTLMKKTMKFLAVAFTFALIAVNLQFSTVNAQSSGLEGDCTEGHTCVETKLSSGCSGAGTDCLVVTPNS
jgi:hypothetical protein